MSDEGSTSSTSFRPDPSDRQALRNAYKQLRYLAFVFLGIALVAGGYAGIGAIRARAFNGGGVITQAFVVGRVYSRYEDKIHVLYTTGRGDVVELRIPVNNPDDFEPGSEINLEVDRNNSRHARTLDGWIPPYQVPIIAAVIMLLLGAFFWLGAERWTRRSWKAATKGQPHQVLLSWVATQGARGARFWRAVLWSPAQPPPSAPILQVRVLEPEGDVGTVEQATVLGDLKHHGVVVIRDSSGFVWPQSRARRPNRATLKALAQFPVGVAAEQPQPAPDDERLPMPAIETLPGGLPPLPPEFFKKDKKKKTSGVGTTVARLATALIVVLGVPILVANVANNRRSCPSLPPASSFTSPVQVSSNAQLVDLIRRLPRPEGFAERNTRGVSADDLAHPIGGYQAGEDVEFGLPNGDLMLIEMLQFDSNEDAVKHWAGTWIGGCVFRHSNFAVAGVPTARGISFATQSGRYIERTYTVRYGRLYMIALNTQTPSLDQVRSETSAVVRSNL